jgi:hypothetical protein
MPDPTKRLVRTVALLAGILAGGPAWGDIAEDAFAAANEAASATSGTKAAEDILFPAIAAMDDMPIGDFMLMLPGDAGWRAFEEWATALAQQAALEALAKIAPADEKYVIGIPYTRRGAPEAWVEAGLYADCGPDDVLFHVSLDYLYGLERLSDLVWVESARLAADGQGAEALDLLAHGVRLGRILCERPFIEESMRGFFLMAMFAERAMDLMRAYRDAFDPNTVADAAERFDPRELEVWKAPFPAGNALAAEQLMRLGFEERGEVSKEELLSFLSANSVHGERPLMAFADAARWEEVVDGHAGWWDTLEQLVNARDDFRMRWEFPHRNDPVLKRQTDYESLDTDAFAIVARTMGMYTAASDLRRRTWVHLGGAYNAFGVVAFELKERNWPPSLPAVEPQYVALLIDDLWNIDERFSNRDLPVLDGYQYFVPIRDQRFGPREEPRPHRIEVRMQGAGGAAAPASALAPEGVDWSDEEVLAWYTNVLGLEEIAGRELTSTSLVDGSTRRLDVGAFRSAALADLDRAEVGPALIQEAAQSIAVVNLLMSGADLGGTLRGLLSTIPVFRQIESAGASLDPYIELASDSTLEIFSSPDFARLKDAFVGGPGEEDVRAWFRLLIDTLATRDFADRAQEVMEAWGPRAVITLNRYDPESAGGGLGGAGEPFAVDVDESTFVLYSLGRDRMDDEARSVGPEGDDHLIWPPLISLMREAGQRSVSLKYLLPPIRRSGALE